MRRLPLRTAGLLLMTVSVLWNAPAGHAAGKNGTHAPTSVTTKKRQTQTGIASWYRTKKRMVAAHRSLPLGTKVTVKTARGRSVTVTVVDRGPFIKGRVIDLSADAFKKLAILGTGVITVTIDRGS